MTENARRPSRLRSRLLLLPAVVGLLAAGSTTAASAANDGYFANLRGATEVPGPGDPNGAGAAVVAFPRDGRVCATISVARIGVPVAAHIHAGPRGVAGPVVIDLTSALAGGRRCVAGVDPALIRAIRSHTARYYVNVHTAAYPDGAVRGQLQN